MKTAISLPDDLFQTAERAARRLRLSRSELYARALEAYLREHEGERITQAIDRVLRRAPQRLDSVLSRLQAASVGPDEGPLEDWALPRRTSRKGRSARG